MLDRLPRPGKPGRRTAFLWLVLAGMIPVLAPITQPSARAVGSNVDLGKPTNAVSTNPYFPLSGFRYVKGLQPAGEARILFIGTLRSSDSTSSIERWPLVKALQQFGAFSHLRPYDRVCYSNPEAGRDICGEASFDWSHASYRSPYLRFDERELLRDTHRAPTKDNMITWAPYQRMNRQELALYRRFTHAPSRSFEPKVDPYNVTGAWQHIPIVIIGNYVQAGPSQVLHEGDIEEQLAKAGPMPTPDKYGAVNVQTFPSGLSFAQVQQALQMQKDPPNTSLVEDTNAEANIITALICRADGRKPARVCRRSVIASLLRHVR